VACFPSDGFFAGLWIGCNCSLQIFADIDDTMEIIFYHFVISGILFLLGILDTMKTIFYHACEL